MGQREGAPAMPLPELFERTREPLNLVLPQGEHGEPGLALQGVGGALPFKMETQKSEEWCWAAVSVSVARFYDSASAWSQCSLVNAEFGLETCCSNGNGEGCNQPWYLENGLDRVGHLSSKVDSSLSFDDLSQEIDKNSPVGCWIAWPDGTGHFVVLDGYSQDFSVVPAAEYVSVRDPKYGNSDYPYLKFLVSYRKFGNWSLSYLTQP
jgi:hypothetical protein